MLYYTALCCVAYPNRFVCNTIYWKLLDVNYFSYSRKFSYLINGFRAALNFSFVHLQQLNIRHTLTTETVNMYKTNKYRSIKRD